MTLFLLRLVVLDHVRALRAHALATQKNWLHALSLHPPHHNMYDRPPQHLQIQKSMRSPKHASLHAEAEVGAFFSPHIQP